MKIEELLKYGKEDATPTSVLCDMTGNESRELRRYIEQRRLDGTLILSKVEDGGGYYLPDKDPQKAILELTECIKTIEARSINSLKSIRILKKERRRLQNILSGQLTLDITESEGVQINDR